MESVNNLRDGYMLQQAFAAAVKIVALATDDVSELPQMAVTTNSGSFSLWVSL